LLEDQNISFNESEFIESLKNIMEISFNAADKINGYLNLYKKDVDFKKEKEFLDLQNYYYDEIFPSIDEDKNWEEEVNRDKSLQFIEDVKDLDSLKKDRSYELFYIKDFFDNMLFSKELIRTFKLLHEYQEIEEKEDLFFDFCDGLDKKNVKGISSLIFNLIKKDIDHLLNIKEKNDLKDFLNEAVLALILSKSSKEKYFSDFLKFLNKAYRSDTYNKMLTYSKKENFLVHFLHKLTFLLYSRSSNVKEEIIGFIYHMINENNDSKSFFEKILFFDQNIENFLKKHPNGPFYKISKSLKNNSKGFDPIFNGNIPQKLYEIDIAKKNVQVLHFPSPTFQDSLIKADITKEFIGYLFYLKNEKKKHILFNFQDGFSFKENARVQALEVLNKRVDFENEFSVFSFDKNSDFYHQVEKYKKITSAETFKKSFKKNMEKYLDLEEYQIFFDKLQNIVHSTFFLEKKDLAREERLDFIEIVYHFFALKIIEDKAPDIISFTCKDGVDTGSSFSFSFLSFLNILNNKILSKKDFDFSIWLIYSKALLNRRRKVDTDKLNRALCFLERINNKEIIDNFIPLFGRSFLTIINGIY
jgi:hypothetical protein